MSEQFFSPVEGSRIRTTFPLAAECGKLGSGSQLSSSKRCNRRVLISQLLTSWVLARDLRVCHRSARVGPQQLPARGPSGGDSGTIVLESPLLADTRAIQGGQADLGCTR